MKTGQMISGVTISWGGTAYTVFEWVTANIGPLLPVIGVVASVIGTIFAIRASRASAKVKRLEAAHRELQLCALCRQGGVAPTVCPVPEDERPAKCPLKQ